MIPAFKEALKKVQAMKNDAGKTYDELIKAGEIPAIKIKENKDVKTGG
jgi:hypothetical protein